MNVLNCITADFTNKISHSEQSSMDRIPNKTYGSHLHTHSRKKGHPAVLVEIITYYCMNAIDYNITVRISLIVDYDYNLQNRGRYVIDVVSSN
jgi:hypothetical protein